MRKNNRLQQTSIASNGSVGLPHDQLTAGTATRTKAATTNNEKRPRFQHQGQQLPQQQQQTSIASDGRVGLSHDQCPASVPQQQNLTYEVYYATFGDSESVDTDVDLSSFTLILKDGKCSEVKPKSGFSYKISVTTPLDEGIDSQALKIILIRGEIIRASEEDLKRIKVGTRFKVPGFTDNADKKGLFPLRLGTNLLDKVDRENFFEIMEKAAKAEAKNERNFLIIRYKPQEEPAAKRQALELTVAPEKLQLKELMKAPIKWALKFGKKNGFVKRKDKTIPIDIADVGKTVPLILTKRNETILEFLRCLYETMESPSSKDDATAYYATMGCPGSGKSRLLWELAKLGRLSKEQLRELIKKAVRDPVEDIVKDTVNFIHSWKTILVTFNSGSPMKPIEARHPVLAIWIRVLFAYLYERFNVATVANVLISRTTCEDDYMDIGLKVIDAILKDNGEEAENGIFIGVDELIKTVNGPELKGLDTVTLSKIKGNPVTVLSELGTATDSKLGKVATCVTTLDSLYIRPTSDSYKKISWLPIPALGRAESRRMVQQMLLKGISISKGLCSRLFEDALLKCAGHFRTMKSLIYLRSSTPDEWVLEQITSANNDDIELDEGLVKAFFYGTKLSLNDKKVSVSISRGIIAHSDSTIDINSLDVPQDDVLPPEQGNNSQPPSPSITRIAERCIVFGVLKNSQESKFKEDKIIPRISFFTLSHWAQKSMGDTSFCKALKDIFTTGDEDMDGKGFERFLYAWEYANMCLRRGEKVRLTDVYKAEWSNMGGAASIVINFGRKLCDYKSCRRVLVPLMQSYELGIAFPENKNQEGFDLMRSFKYTERDGRQHSGLIFIEAKHTCCEGYLSYDEIEKKWKSFLKVIKQSNDYITAKDVKTVVFLIVSVQVIAKDSIDTALDMMRRVPSVKIGRSEVKIMSGIIGGSHDKIVDHFGKNLAEIAMSRLPDLRGVTVSEEKLGWKKNVIPFVHVMPIKASTKTKYCTEKVMSRKFNEVVSWFTQKVGWPHWNAADGLATNTQVSDKARHLLVSYNKKVFPWDHALYQLNTLLAVDRPESLSKAKHLYDLGINSLTELGCLGGTDKKLYCYVPCRYETLSELFLPFKNRKTFTFRTFIRASSIDIQPTFPENFAEAGTLYSTTKLEIICPSARSTNGFTGNDYTDYIILPYTPFRLMETRCDGTIYIEEITGQTLRLRQDIQLISWKECPDYVDETRKYSTDEVNPRVATKTGDDYRNCTVIGNTPLPPNKVTSWSIKALELRRNDGRGIYIGVAPSDIDQNIDDNYKKCGWYFNCYGSMLYSGPPQNYWKKEYGLRKEGGNYVHTGDSVGIVMDTTKGELSFAVNGVNLGVAYEGIPLDKPLVPCVLLGLPGDSVELDMSEVKEIVCTLKSFTWDSITLSWNAVKGALFYQIEMDGDNLCDTTIVNTFTKAGLFPDTEHSFRVRAVCGNEVSEWSDEVKGRTKKVPNFSNCVWKECPDYVDEKREYSVDEVNSRVATMIGSYLCTIIGNTPLPLNKVTSWSIKIIESGDNDGNGIFIGVAPYDINQNEEENYKKCGWYFDCYNSRLYHGPPHNHPGKDYGPRKGHGKYVHTEDSVGIFMDTTKGELSFIVNGVNFGVAYEGIPLDKPLVPCVLLYYKGDSVELDTSEVKENASCFIHVPSNITTKGTAWDSITLTWNAVEGASFYQIEVDGSKFWGATTTNVFTKRGLLPETEHSFRVRTVRGNEVSEWSGVVKVRTVNTPEFTESVWKECPDYVGKKRKYSVDEVNPRVATKKRSGCCCITIGNTPLPLNKVTSWSIKILKSRDNDGGGIYIGVAPSDIDQNEYDNRNKCGWYFNCCGSMLCSGPPHNYNYSYKEYGPRKGDGKYVHTGDSVGVVMDTTKGELSFAVNGADLGVAYDRIPLDKPLVPCVILYYKGDSVELII